MSEKKVGRKKSESGLEKKSGPEKNGAGKKAENVKLLWFRNIKLTQIFCVDLCEKWVGK